MRAYILGEANRNLFQDTDRSETVSQTQSDDSKRKQSYVFSFKFATVDAMVGIKQEVLPIIFRILFVYFTAINGRVSIEESTIYMNSDTDIERSISLPGYMQRFLSSTKVFNV